jgi:hypothetical protein
MEGDGDRGRRRYQQTLWSLVDVYLFCLFTIRLLVYGEPVPHGPKRRSAVPPSIAARSFVVLNP